MRSSPIRGNQWFIDCLIQRQVGRTRLDASCCRRRQVLMREDEVRVVADPLRPSHIVYVPHLVLLLLI